MATSLELIREARRLIVQHDLFTYREFGIGSIQSNFESIESRIDACRARMPNALLDNEKADLISIRNSLSGQRLILLPFLEAHSNIAGVDKVRKCYAGIFTNYESELLFLDNTHNRSTHRQNSASSSQGRTNALLNAQSINLNLPTSFTQDRLNEGVIEIGMRVGRVAAEQAIGGAFNGAIGGAVAGGVGVVIIGGRKIYEGGMAAIQCAMGNPLPVLFFVAKEIGENAARGAAVGLAAGAVAGAYQAAAYEYRFRIDMNGIVKLAMVAENRRALVQAFVDDPQFIETSVTVELIDPISLGVIFFPVKTPCGHIFEKKGITTWIQQGNQNCPTCRTSITGVDKLQFSWVTYIKIIKMMRGIMHWVNLNPPQLPPRLVTRSLPQIRQLLGDLDKCSYEQSQLVCTKVRDALRDGRKQGSISADSYDDDIAELKRWEKF